MLCSWDPDFKVVSLVGNRTFYKKEHLTISGAIPRKNAVISGLIPRKDAVIRKIIPRKNAVISDFIRRIPVNGIHLFKLFHEFIRTPDLHFAVLEIFQVAGHDAVNSGNAGGGYHLKGIFKLLFQGFSPAIGMQCGMQSYRVIEFLSFAWLLRKSNKTTLHLCTSESL